MPHRGAGYTFFIFSKLFVLLFSEPSRLVVVVTLPPITELDRHQGGHGHLRYSEFVILPFAFHNTFDILLPVKIMFGKYSVVQSIAFNFMVAT